MNSMKPCFSPHSCSPSQVLHSSPGLHGDLGYHLFTVDYTDEVNTKTYKTNTQLWDIDLGVSENSVPLFTQWLMIIIPIFYGYFIGNIPYFQTNTIGYIPNYNRVYSQL